MLKQIQLLFTVRTPKRKRAAAPISGAGLPDLQRLWTTLIHTYYPTRTDLLDYTVTWSRRAQKRVLASCNIRSRRVVVAVELLEPCAERWIEAVLYHELCHAVIGELVARPGGRRLWHGVQFRTLEQRHPAIPALEAWIKSGGWALAVRSNRSRTAWQRRRGRSPSRAMTIST